MLLSGAFALTLGPAMAQVSWDLNADGALDPQEFVPGFGALARFATFDTDGSGQLDQAEWDSGLGVVGEYANMDLNGDGGVDEAEFNALLFNRYDGDGSGALEAEEIAMVEADLAEDGLLAR
tara:strand:+ start:335 stop:700 length:366 start_codon:yes stop_codon:yes gene_type:complete